jgi:hypothetical protein
MNEITECPSCKFSLDQKWYFCPNCGKQLREAPIVISIPKQILIYFVSFFLAPLGLGWGLKYIKYKDNKVKIVGIISIILTILAIVLMIGSFKYVMDQYTQMLNGLTTGKSY